MFYYKFSGCLVVPLTLTKMSLMVVCYTGSMSAAMLVIYCAQLAADGGNVRLVTEATPAVRQNHPSRLFTPRTKPFFY